MSAPPTRLTGFDETVALEDLVDGIDARDGVDRGVELEDALDLAGSPAPVLPDLEDAVDDVGRRGVRAGAWPARAILQAVEPLLLVASEPLVAGGPADAVSAAELGEGEVGELGFEHEASAFGLHGGRSPWHRDLPVEGAPRYSGRTVNHQPRTFRKG